MSETDDDRFRIEPFQAKVVARVFDVPPWLIGITPAPRFPRLRWALRHWWPL